VEFEIAKIGKLTLTITLTLTLTVLDALIHYGNLARGRSHFFSLQKNYRNKQKKTEIACLRQAPPATLTLT
jgi:hypothetical protein